MSVYLGPVIRVYRPRDLAACLERGVIFRQTSIPGARVEYFLDARNGKGPYRHVADIHHRPDGTPVVCLLHGATVRDQVRAATAVLGLARHPETLTSCTCGICRATVGYVMVHVPVGADSDQWTMSAVESVPRTVDLTEEVTAR